MNSLYVTFIQLVSHFEMFVGTTLNISDEMILSEEEWSAYK